jgi:DNA-binding XRE family transcriptional regulator
MKYTLKELRARKEVTQSETAKTLGISLQTYNSWEKNPGKIPFAYIDRLSRYLNVCVDDIFLPRKLN